LVPGTFVSFVALRHVIVALTPATSANPLSLLSIVEARQQDTHMSSRISTVAYYASLSRLAIWVVAVVSHALIQDYDSSLELVLPIQTPSQQLFKSVFGVFLRWDSFYFTHTAKNGYAFEQAHAFFPLLSMLMRLVASTGMCVVEDCYSCAGPGSSSSNAAFVR
jgi:hypothetical protein